MIDGTGAPVTSGEEFSSGTPRATLLSRLHEPVDRGDRLDVAARLTSVVAGVAVLAALPFDLYALYFPGGHQGFHVTLWGRIIKFGTRVVFDFQPPVYGYLLAAAAAVVVLTAWAYPRCATLALAVLAGCAGLLVIQIRALAAQDPQHATIGPALPVFAGVVALACLVRFVAWARRD